MATFSQNMPLPFGSIVLNNAEGNNFLEPFPFSQMNDPPKELIRIIDSEPVMETNMMSYVKNGNEFYVNNGINLPQFPSQIVVPSQPLLCYNGVLFGNPVDVVPNQIILSPFNTEPVLINAPVNQEPINQLILTNPVNTNEMIYTCPSGIIKNDMVLTAEVPCSDLAEASEEPAIEDDNSSGDNFNDSMNENSLVDDSEENFAELSATQSVETEETDLSKIKTLFPCSYCGKAFEKPFNLNQHERIHTGERPFQCIICGRAFTQKSNVRKHMLRHRVWPHAKQTLKIAKGQNQKDQDLLNQMNYACQYCSSSFQSYGLYKKHLATHSNFKVYRCIQKNCNETFRDLDEFLVHSRTHSSVEFQCHICLKAFTSLEELGAHQYDHDNFEKKQKKSDLTLKCKICHAKFKTIESLKNHMAVDPHKYECSQCDSTFNSERFLRRHFIGHLGPSYLKFKCSQCPKTFRSQNTLNDHGLVHQKEKPFTCEHCNKKFVSKYRMKRHMAIHMDHYLECPYKEHLGCDKTFYRKDKLRDHVNSHTRLQSCKDCSKTFTSSTKLNQHIRKIHKNEKKESVLRCDNCLQTFRKEKQMKQHHCTVGEKKSWSKVRDSSGEPENSENVSNIEIIMVPLASEPRS